MHNLLAQYLREHKNLPIVCNGKTVTRVGLEIWSEEEQSLAGIALQSRICLYTNDEGSDE